MSPHPADPLDRLAAQGWALLDVAGWDGAAFRNFEPGPMLLAHFRRDALAGLLEAFASHADVVARLLEIFPRTGGVVGPGVELVAIVRLLDRLGEHRAHQALDDPSDGALAGFLLPDAAADAIELLLHADAVPAAGRLACAALVAALGDDAELRARLAGDANARRRLDASLRLGLDLAGEGGPSIPEPLVIDMARWIVDVLRSARERGTRPD